MGRAFFGQEAEFAGVPQFVHTLKQRGDWALPIDEGCCRGAGGLGLCGLEKRRRHKTRLTRPPEQGAVGC